MSLNAPLFNMLMLGGSPARGLFKTRKFLQFNGTDIHAFLHNEIVFSGDFEIEIKAAFTAPPTATQIFTGSNEVGTDSLGAESGTHCRFQIANTVLTAAYTTVTPYDGDFHVWKGSRVGAVGSLTIDGIPQVSGAVPITASSWEKIGGFSGVDAAATNRFAGEIEYIKFTDLETSATTLYHMVGGSVFYEQEVGAVRPTEIMPDPDLNAILDNWRIVQDQGLTILDRGFRMEAPANTSQQSIGDTLERNNTLIDPNKYYVLEFEIANLVTVGTAGYTMQFYLGNSNNKSLSFDSNGRYQMYMKGSVGTVDYGDVYGVFSISAPVASSGQFDCVSISVKEVPDAASLFNVAAGDWLSKRWNATTEMWDVI